MSSPIWTPAALSSEVHPYEGLCWRLVEAQHQVSTLKLVDDLEEQALLEGLIETTKPPLPPDCLHLDYLLATPFRYGAVYPVGSRFRRAGRTPGVFYAAETPATAIAEMAFHRLLFFADSLRTSWPADAADYTAFSAAIATARMLDLTEPPLVDGRAAWTDRVAYEPCQRLAETARAAEVALLRYESVRDPVGGAALAVLSSQAFAEPRPRDRQTWRIRLGPTGVQAICQFPDLRIGFGRDAFVGDPRIAALDWER